MPWLIVFLAATALARTHSSTGIARSGNGSHLYTEESRVELSHGKPLKSSHRYLSPAGVLIAQLDADYSTHAFVPDFTLQDFAHDTLQSLRYEPSTGSLELSRKKSRNATIETSRLEFNAHKHVAGPGCFFFAKEHFQKMLLGETLTIAVVAPAYLDEFPFRLKVAGSRHSTIDVELSYDNFFIRLFAPDVSFGFLADGSDVVEYTGPAPIPNSDGDFEIVSVSYKTHR